jgi:hypothetical protein
MIQDIAPHILQNQYQNIRPAEQDPVFCFRNESILLKTEIILPFRCLNS